MASPASSPEEKQAQIKERLADKESIKTILRRYTPKFAELLINAALNDLDLER